MLSENKKNVHRDVSESIRRMLSENKDILQNTLAETKKTLRDILLEKQTIALQQAAGTDTQPIQGVLWKLPSLNQQRENEERNPPLQNRCTFRFHISRFKDLIESEKRVFSEPYALGLENNALIVRGVADFRAGKDALVIGLEHVSIGDTKRNSGGDGLPLRLDLIARIKAQNHPPSPLDIDLGRVALLRSNRREYLTMSQHVGCKRLIQDGYDSYRKGSVLIEFEIARTQGKPRRSPFWHFAVFVWALGSCFSARINRIYGVITCHNLKLLAIESMYAKTKTFRNYNYAVRVTRQIYFIASAKTSDANSIMQNMKVSRVKIAGIRNEKRSTAETYTSLQDARTVLLSQDWFLKKLNMSHCIIIFMLISIFFKYSLIFHIFTEFQVSYFRNSFCKLLNV